MTAIVEGMLKQGIIELREVRSGLQEGPVRVIVITKEPSKPPPCLLTLGKYRQGQMSTLEDFEAAQRHGEAQFDASGASESWIHSSDLPHSQGDKP